jgi:uncharacterized protein (TIGR03083 family)
MMLPGERALRDERESLLATMQSLTDEQFESGLTLCEGWAPRDILAHVMGVDTALPQYFRAGGWISTGNQLIVRKARRRSADQLLAEAETWVSRPAPWTRASAVLLLGDNAIHHQDVLRPLGRTREIPEASKAAILREGALLGARRLLTHRVEPTDGGRPAGRGTTVRGSREALGMWLSGRSGIETDLDFAQEAAA